MYGLSYEPSTLPASAPVGVGTSAVGVVAVSVGVAAIESCLGAFFFLELLDSDLVDGF